MDGKLGTTCPKEEGSRVGMLPAPLRLFQPWDLGSTSAVDPPSTGGAPRSPGRPHPPPPQPRGIAGGTWAPRQPSCPFGSGEGSRQPLSSSGRGETDARHDYRDPPEAPGPVPGGQRGPDPLRGFTARARRNRQPRNRPTRSSEPRQPLRTAGTPRWGGTTRCPVRPRCPRRGPSPQGRQRLRTAPSSPASAPPRRGRRRVPFPVPAPLPVPLRSAASTGRSGGGGGGGR